MKSNKNNKTAANKLNECDLNIHLLLKVVGEEDEEEKKNMLVYLQPNRL